MKKLIKRFKNIKPQTLLAHAVVTLLYPFARAVSENEQPRAVMASSQRLLIFTDCMTIVAAILLIAGVIYSLYLHGDFDISSYVMRRARSNAPKQTFEAYKANQKERREASFNYLLFLGVVYMAAALFIAYVIY